MAKKLVLAEKPSVGREIARVLKCHKNGNGYIEGQDYIVTWALGHLVTLADPDAYNKAYSQWRMEDLPIVPDHMKYIIMKKTRKQYETVKRQLLRNDVNEVVIATDAGREGELVARLILLRSGCKKPLKRLWISSVTDKAIKEGFKHLKDGRAYDNLYYSALARAEADWIVGINASRALTCKYNAQLSCGRVQTPTLAMVAQRDEEIKNFKPETYYGLDAEIKKTKFVWHHKKHNSPRSFNEEDMQKRYTALSAERKGTVVDVKKTRKKSYAPTLYDLTDLQRDANRLYNFSAKETLNIMQKLYESHKVLTYPRTDSRYLTEDMVPTLKERVKACCIGPHQSIASPLLKMTLKGKKSFVNNQKVSDHHAIVPTEERPILQKFSSNERKIYDLVVKRFLAVLYPPCEFDQTKVAVEVKDEVFTVVGNTIIEQGYKKVYDLSSDDEETVEKSLPEFNKGDEVIISSVKLTNGKTKPPAPFTEGTLLGAMENPAKYMKGENKDLVKTMNEAGGIGTVATRADIIDKLFNHFLLEKKDQKLQITSKGRQLLELVPKDLRSPALTAKWEQKLVAISKGKLKKGAFINEMTGYTKEIVLAIKNSEERFKHDNVSGTRCSECGKFMLEVKGKKGKMLVCQDRNCGNRENISQITNIRCSTCHKKMELRGKGDGKILVCSCGERMKYSAFLKNKKQKSKGGNKGDIKRYMKEQKKDEGSFNNAFGDAFSKLNIGD